MSERLKNGDTGKESAEYALSEWSTTEDGLRKYIEGMKIDMADLQERYDKAIEGLKWYADGENYYAHYPDGDFAIDLDKGKRARQTLKDMGVGE